jgi:hypothetical protein
MPRIQGSIRDRIGKTLDEWEQEHQMLIKESKDKDAALERSQTTDQHRECVYSDEASDGMPEIDSDLEDALQEFCPPPNSVGRTNEFTHRNHLRDIFGARSLALAFLMGLHPRLGTTSPVVRLDTNTVYLILDAVHPDLCNEEPAFEESAFLDFRDTLVADESLLRTSMEEEEDRYWDGNCESSETEAEEVDADLNEPEIEAEEQGEYANADLNDEMTQEVMGRNTFGVADVSATGAAARAAEFEIESEEEEQEEKVEKVEVDELIDEVIHEALGKIAGIVGSESTDASTPAAAAAAAAVFGDACEFEPEAIDALRSAGRVVMEEACTLARAVRFLLFLLSARFPPLALCGVRATHEPPSASHSNFLPSLEHAHPLRCVNSLAAAGGDTRRKSGGAGGGPAIRQGLVRGSPAPRSDFLTKGLPNFSDSRFLGSDFSHLSINTTSLH